MTEIYLSALTNLSTVQGAQPGQDNRAAQVPSILAALPPGTLLRGFVLNRDPRGNPILRTDSGDFLIQSDFFMKIGSDVVVRIDASGRNFRASIVSVDGQTPGAAENTPAHAEDADFIAPSARERPAPQPAVQASAPAAPRAAPATNIITATLVKAADPNPFNPAPASAPPPLAPGSVLQLRVLSITTPGGNIPAATAEAAATLPAAVPAVTTNPPAASYTPAGGSPPLVSVPATPPATAAAPAQAPFVATPASTAPASALPASAPANPAATTVITTSPQNPATPATQAVTTPAASPITAPAISPAAPQLASSPAPPATIPATAASAAPPAAIPTPAPNIPAAPAASQQYGAYKHTAQFIPDALPSPAAALPGAAPAARNAVPAVPVTVEGVVISTQQEGETFLATPLGTLKLAQPLSFPPGTSLKTEIAAYHPADTSTAPAAGTPAALVQLAAGWSGLQQIITTLEDGGDNASLAFLKSVLPQFNAGNDAAPNAGQHIAQQLTTALPAFLAALTSGDMRAWLGRAGRALEERPGGKEALTQAEGEFQNMRTLAGNISPQQWQGVFLPVLVEGELKQLRFYSKRERKKQEPGRPAEGDTRFVVEMDFTQLGPLQLDGFIKKREGRTQFDLIVRTHAPLDTEARGDIQRIFSITGDATGYKGMLIFQDSAEFPVQPLEEILKDNHRDVVA